MILVDSNEPEELVEELRKVGLKVERKQLRCYKCQQCGRLYPNTTEKCPECDTLPTKDTPTVRVADITDDKGRFGIERKTEGDYWSSLVDKRIYDQVKNIAKAYGMNGALVIEGSVDSIAMDHPRSASWVYSVRGECWNVGIHFEQAGDMEGIARMVYWINQKLGTEVKERLREVKMPEVDYREAALRQCPGIGPDRSKLLFFLFKSLRKISQAPRNVLLELPKFGEKTVDALKDFWDGEIQVEWKLVKDDKKPKGN